MIGGHEKGYRVMTRAEVFPEEADPDQKINWGKLFYLLGVYKMNNFDRPEELKGLTYKIKPPTIDCAIYITINDSPIGPCEIFINSKHVESFEWINALMRMASALLQNSPEGKDTVIRVLKETYDPRGGYAIKGGFVTGIVAHIGKIFEEHCLLEK